MKILSLYFKNINSLGGESRIHFDQAPIVDGGVFAITGPNGSGKSSILDAITLGLYGETFRFDRPAEHVMTKSTTESFAEVEFALADNKFRSSWRVNRKDGNAAGDLLAPTMTLLQLNGSERVLEESTQKVRDRLLELTGMDFHKFSKSMILAQGDFAAFLNALDSERMDILEKISGADIYADYKSQAEETHTQAQTRLQQLEQDLSAIPVMDAATLEASAHDLADFKEQQVELKIELNEAEQQLAGVQVLTELSRQIESLTNKQQLEQSQLEETQQTLERIEASQDLISFEEQLTAVDNKVEVTQESKKTLDSYRSELEMLQKQLKSAGFSENIPVTAKTLSQQKNSIDQLKLKLSDLKFNLPKESALLQSLTQQIDEKKSVLSTTEKWLQEHVGDKSLLENFPEIGKLRKLRAELIDLTVKQKASKKWTKSTTEGIKKKKTDINALTKKNDELTTQVEVAEKSLKTMAEGNSLEDLQEMETEQKERVSNFLELYDLAKVNAKLGKKSLFAQVFGSKGASKEEQQLTTELDHLQLEIGKEQNLVKTLENAVTNEQLLKKMEADRQYLIDGKPCPLCGALEHPYSKHAPAASNSKQVLIEQQKKVKTLTANAESLSKQIASAHQQAEKDEQKDSQLEFVRSQWMSLANRLNAAGMELSFDNLSMMKDLLNTEKKELSNISNLLKQVTKLKSSVEKAKSTIKTNEVISKRLITEAEVLEAEWDSRPQESVDLEQAYTQCQQQEQALADKVLEQLNQLGEKMPAKGKEDALFERLNSRRLEYQTRAMRHKSLTEEIQSLEPKIIASSSKINEINHDIQQSSEHVQQEEMAGLHLSLIEKQKLIAEKETVFSQQEAELDSLKQSLQDKTKDTAAADLTALRETISLNKRQPEILLKQMELSQSLSTIQNSLDKVQTKLQDKQAVEKSKYSEEELLVQQKTIKEKIDIARQEVESLQSKLDKQESFQEKQEDLLAKIASQKIEVEACVADIKLISDESGVQFRRKVQQVMADQLLSQANQVLEKLSGRYYVRRVESEHGLALAIEDTKQNNVRRLPKTLSGGESFIVSLALALSLAEMSNNGHALDSLFLDEGFGNLDAEALYLAMTTLESLKTHGKVVGVISHVEGVRKRIKTQIKMTKKPNGLSALKVIS